MSSQYINEPVTSGKVILHTTAGEIEIELWTKECPLACRNFIQLCMEGYYDGTIFHRLIKGFIIQGGDPQGTGIGGESIYGHPFKDEFHQRLKFNRRGLLGMANAGPNDNGSQFFFTVGDEGIITLNKKHTLFGKIVGPTVFNMLKMVECDVDENDKPRTIHKVVKAVIVTNPFDDIKPREKVKKSKEKKKEAKVVETKKLNLLSFGDEAEEDEAELEQVNKTLSKKGKSAHDVLEEEGLSKEVAVEKNEMADYDPDEDAEKDTSTVSSIRAKLASKKKETIKDDEDNGEDVDFDDMMANQKKAEEKKALERMAAELKSLQKEHVKALRKPKEKEEEQEEEPQTDALKKYTGMKLKYKSKVEGLLKRKDPTRENQTEQLMEKFKKKLKASNQNAILFDKKVVVAEEKKEEKKFGIDLDAEATEEGNDWMAHKFVAEDEETGESKAKDANLKDSSEDWYDINHPMNKMNMRRRGAE